jgi:2-polyprenyl-6-methoxyphenol hydroxylase-like FAD-dependent oxidoreductase
VDVLIAGAGIGGLAAALALHDRGIDVRLREAVIEPRGLGVGINLLPHATAELERLGLLEAIAAQGVRTAELRYYNRHGQRIWAEPRGLAAGYPVPQVSVHRGRLQLALLEAARERLGADAVGTGLELVAFAGDGDGVAVERADRACGGRRRERATVLVAADGIHSTVRRALYPDEGPPRFSGNMLWRATSRFEPFLDGRTMFMAGHRPHKFVAYPIGAVAADGLQEINWIAELDRRDAGLPAREDWNREGRLADFAPRFDDWRFDWLDVPALIRAAERVYEFPMVDRDPLPRWTFGRTTLLGDAAHAMYPIGSNGASQAILDARALADALAEEDDADVALARYEAARRPATAAIVHANRAHGPERVLDLAEERAPAGFASVDDVFAAGELEAIAASYKRTAGFAPQAPPR